MSHSTSKPPPTKPPPGGASRAGTPNPSQPLPSHSEFGALLHGHGGLVKLAQEAHRWMEARGWVLAGEPYDHMKLMRVLMTAVVTLKGLKLEVDAKNVVLTVAFLLEEDVNNKLLDTLVNMVTSKVLECMKPVVHCIALTLDFASANDTAQAETTLALKSVLAQLKMVSSSLNNIVTKLSTTPLPPTSQPATTHTLLWVDIASTKPTSVLATFNPMLSDQHTHLQQRLIYSVKTILITAEPSCTNAPLDHSPTMSYKLWGHINKLLTKIDKSGANLAAINGVAPTPAKMVVCSISWIKRGAYLFKLDTMDSAACFRSYAHDPT
ncbi:hypothetical protein C0989_011405 [Termitomyces sp. Mn162]|nr:hypothetical protein C0989_011405 [Termitomyces sp. Mn162]